MDLYLLHWPVPRKRLDSWRALERLFIEGRCRASGVSNFMEKHLAELLDAPHVAPRLGARDLEALAALDRNDRTAWDPTDVP